MIAYQGDAEKIFFIEDFQVDLGSKTLNITLQQDNSDEKTVSTWLNDILSHEVVVLKTLSKKHWFWSFLGLASGLGLLSLSLILGPMSLALMLPIAVVSTSLTLIMGYPFYKKAFKDAWQHGRLTMDSLFTLSSISALLISIGGLVIPGLPMMFDIGLLMFGFSHLGLALQSLFAQDLMKFLRFQDLVSWKHPYRVLNGEAVCYKTLNELKVGDTVCLQAGEVVPLDAKTLALGLFDALIATGCSVPQYFQKDDLLLAGMRYAGQAPLNIKITNTKEESYLVKLDKILLELKMQHIQQPNLLDGYLQYFIPGVLMIAMLAALAVGYGFGVGLGLQCMVAVLASACPCTLGMIIPLTENIGLRKAYHQGIFFKRSEKLITAAQLNCVVFDLTGTLTQGCPILQKDDIVSLDENWSNNDIIQHMASLEYEVNHPFAVAICNYAKSVYIPCLDVENSDKQANKITGEILGRYYFLGDESMMKNQGIDVSFVSSRLVLDAQDRVVYLARQDQLLGYVILKDPLRSDAINVVKTLQNKGIHVCICTGAPLILPDKMLKN